MIDIEETIEKVANFFGYTTADVVKKDKSHDVSNARNFIFYILHCKCGMSSNAIAKKFERGTRHIKHQNATTKYRVENFKDFKDTYAQLEASIE
jgi:chromosomal replication initiation ATPase DnaA